MGIEDGINRNKIEDQHPPTLILMHAIMHPTKRRMYSTKEDYGQRPTVLIKTLIPCLISGEHF